MPFLLDSIQSRNQSGAMTGMLGLAYTGSSGILGGSFVHRCAKAASWAYPPVEAAPAIPRVGLRRASPKPPWAS